MSDKFQKIIIAVALSMLSFSANADSTWNIQQVTDNTYRDQEPVLSDKQVAWLARPTDATHDEVFAYDGTNTTRLTDNALNEQNLFASDKYIAWNWRDGTKGDDIFLYDGLAVSRITETLANEYRPRVDGEKMVWETSGDIVVYDIISGDRLTLSPPVSSYDRNPWIHGNSVAFVTNLGSRLYVYDIVNDSYDQVTTGIANGPEMNDGYIVYDYYYNVKLYDRTAKTVKGIGSGVGATISGQFIVWAEDTSTADYGDSLYIYDASDAGNTKQLIASNIDQRSQISIDGNLIVYEGWDGSDLEIYIYDITAGTTTQLTNNDYRDDQPRIRGNRITWVYFDGPDEDTGDEEIMLATKVTAGAEGDCSFFVLPGASNQTAVICL